ncbi:hypothetical protein ACL598_15405 [Bordetella bronchialis]|uniref:hypothetical protein n=1 Tax=Bordetella bronchialis TaxID=463025 RepID=UPI003D08662F
MAIDGEPKDGDYVRYIEALINRGQAAPGQVMGRARGVPSASPPPSPGEVVRDAAPAGAARDFPPGFGQPVPASPGIPRPFSWGRGAGSKASSAPRDANPASDATLAGRAARRRGAFAVAIVAIAIAWQAMRMLYDALRQPDFDPHALIPVAFLLVFAGMLWRAARSGRAQGKQPPARLPPLTTVSHNGPDKAGR